MIGEVDVYGVFVSPLLIWIVATLPIVALLRRLLARAGFYRLVWHRPLFDLALLIVVLGGVVAVTSRWFTL
jgi:hypothetical protein